jgi:hypothetical protein
MELLFPRLTQKRVVLFLTALAVCLCYGGDPSDGEAILEASIILTALASAAAHKGAKAAGNWVSQKMFEASPEGKAAAAVTADAAKVVQATAGELMPGEAQTAKAINAALANARAIKREKLATEGGVKGPVASGVQAIQATEDRHKEAALAADVAAQVHSVGAQAAVARKAAAARTIMATSTAEQERMAEQGGDVGEAVAAGALGGIKAGQAMNKERKKLKDGTGAALGPVRT